MQCNAMYVCMCVCMHACMYVFHFHNSMYIILDARIYIHTYIYIYMNTIILQIPTTKPWTEPHHVICWATRCNLQDEDIIPECEWLAGIYGLRRPHELGTYGWQSCDEIQDPESSRRGDFLQRSQTGFVSAVRLESQEQTNLCASDCPLTLFILGLLLAPGTRRIAATNPYAAAKRCGNTCTPNGALWHHRRDKQHFCPLRILKQRKGQPV